VAEHVFISYARDDAAYAHRLAEELRRRGFDVWIDKNIRHGERWAATLEQAVRDCAALIVIMTPEAEISEWVRNELKLALAGNKPVFPLLLKGQPFESLDSIQYADVKNQRLPMESFFGDLTMAPGVKSDVEQFLYKKRSEYQKAISKSPLKDVFRRYEIESGMIDDPEEVKRWKDFGEDEKE
jgi:TIR domain-containing protein